MSKPCAGIYGFFFALFGLLCYLANRLPYFPGDITAGSWLQGIDISFLNPVMRAASYISSFTPAFIIVTLIVIGLWVSRRRLEAIFVAALTSSAALLNWLLKLLISRPRPAGELIQVLSDNNGLSFPSGHVTYAVVFYSFLFYLTPRLVKQPVAAGILRSLLIIFILATMASRVYLGAHWPSDTLGSLLLGGLLLAPTIALYNNYAKVKTGDKNA